MAFLNCFSTLVLRKKKDKNGRNSSNTTKPKNGLGRPQVKLERHVKPIEPDVSDPTAFGITIPFNIPKNTRCSVKVSNHESPINCKAAVEVAYEGEDECDDKSPIWWDNSENNLQEFQFGNSAPTDQSQLFSAELSQCIESKKTVKDCIEGIGAVQGGHLSDPGTTRVDVWASPSLKRSCSSLDPREVLKKIAHRLPPTKSQSFEQLQELAEKVDENALPGTPCTHTSSFTHFSADKVILKKRSSSQILPSRSRRLWWKLYLWSHRNSQKSLSHKTGQLTLVFQNQQGGYSSDTLEPSQMKLSKPELSPGMLPEEHIEKDSHNYKGNGRASRWVGFHSGVSGLWPQNQWVAFSMQSSPMKRVDEWVRELEVQSSDPAYEAEMRDVVVEFPPSPGTHGSMAGSVAHPTQYQTINISEDLLYANRVIHSLNSSSSVAHISGMGLKVIPSISPFFRLRSVNLSNNYIAHITTGSLPKGLHILDLSRNKISNIEGLRDLIRLRVLNLSYNRISRIGHGLSNCMLLKELYLAGNKISDVEGLHRLLKLTLLDLSFNKITTSKALGQLVANYNSLVALNLLGNPIQSNLSEDQLRKGVCGLLPKLAYLNKQPINQQKAREVAMDIIVKASSTGNGSRTGHRKTGWRKGQEGANVSKSGKSNLSVGHRGRNRMKRMSHNQSNTKMKSPA